MPYIAAMECDFSLDPEFLEDGGVESEENDDFDPMQPSDDAAAANGGCWASEDQEIEIETQMSGIPEYSMPHNIV